MEIETRSRDGVTVLHPHTARLDDGNVGELQQALAGELSGDGRVVLNLRDVEFMDSSALGALISGLRRRQGRGEMALCEVHDSVLSLLRLTGLVRIFPCFATEDEARAASAGRAV